MTDNNRDVVEYDPNAIRALMERAGLSWRLFWDGRVSFLNKLIPVGTLAYIVSPIDLVPELLLGPLAPLGLLDDVGILALGLGLFIQAAPTDLVQEHLRAITGRTGSGPEYDYGDDDVVEGDYEVLDDE